MTAGTAPGKADASVIRATIDLAALARNWRQLATVAAGAECAAVVKADAYGTGIARAVPALAAAGCRTFFVALPEEGVRARAAAGGATIYVLDGFIEADLGRYRAADLRPVLNSPAEVDAWLAAGGGPAALHVDTGMNRLGLSLDEFATLTAAGDRWAALAPALLMSHLACADTPAHPLNRQQAECFAALRRDLPDVPASLANSAGIFLGPDFICDLARPGIALYGAPFASGRPPLETVVTLQARILQVRDVGAGGTVGYGAARSLAGDSRIAILAAGYADGYLRQAGSDDSHQGASAWLRGRSVPLVGRVSMDLVAVDVTAVPDAARGDWVELFGPHAPIGGVAAAAGTIGYELLTGLSRRADRRYVGGGGH